MIVGMNERPNPYTSPAPDPNAVMRAKRRKRKFTQFLFTAGLFIVLFVGYWGIRVTFALLNGWLFGH